MGDAMSIRAGFHVVLAIAFVVLLILKFTIVRAYRNFLKHASVLGMMIFTLAVIVFAISAGFIVVIIGISASSSRGLGASNFQFRGGTMSGEGQCYPGEFES